MVYKPGQSADVEAADKSIRFSDEASFQMRDKNTVI